MKSFLVWDKNLPVQHSQYYECWCPGNARSQGISKHDVYYVIGFNHGLPWCVKYMARGHPVTTKPDGEAGGFCGDQRPEMNSIHSDHFGLHLYNIHQCQLTISWVTMVTCGTIAFPEGILSTASPNYIWFQCFTHGADLQINADGNELIQNWNFPISSQVMFFFISITSEKMWIEKGFCG